MQAHADLPVRVITRAARDEIAGERAGRVLVRVSAPPVEGKANEAVCRLIAKRAGLSRRQVSVLRGATSRDKLVRVHGIDIADLRRALGT